MDNHPTLYKLLLFFQSLRAGIHIFLYFLSPSKTVIEKDLDRWAAETEDMDGNANHVIKLVWFLWRFPEFRNLYNFRIKRDRQIASRVLMEFGKLLFPPMNTLFLETPMIGEGLFIQHGFSTIVSAESIGKNCTINQQVSIGYVNKEDRPTIGDNVHITAGAKVLGRVSIGDNSIVGANAVVLKNVPPNCTVVGVPAYIVRRDGQKVKETL